MACGRCQWKKFACAIGVPTESAVAFLNVRVNSTTQGSSNFFVTFICRSLMNNGNKVDFLSYDRHRMEGEVLTGSYIIPSWKGLLRIAESNSWPRTSPPKIQT